MERRFITEYISYLPAGSQPLSADVGIIEGKEFLYLFDVGADETVAEFLNTLPKEKKLNPMIGACGISAFPMSARVVYKMAIKEDPQNYLLMQCVGVNVSGQVASVIAGGLLLNLLV